MLKLRTMHVDAGDQLDATLASSPEVAERWLTNFKIDDDPRVTRVGHHLRRLSLDELPQLWNVLNGDMSLVGPRPKLLEEREAFGAALDEVLAPRPGLTGLWQVSGRSATTYERRIELDLEYVRNQTLAGDFAILLRTFAVLSQPEGQAK